MQISGKGNILPDVSALFIDVAAKLEVRLSGTNCRLTMPTSVLRDQVSIPVEDPNICLLFQYNMTEAYANVSGIDSGGELQ